MQTPLQHQAKPGLPFPLPTIVTVSGIAWSQQWEPPRFRGSSPRVDEIPTHFHSPISPLFLTSISGISWWYPFNQPFQKRTKFWIHQSHPAYGSPFAIPVKIAGMAWYVRFDEPKYVKVKPSIQQTELRMFVAQSAGISGISWWYPFDPPMYGNFRVDYTRQQYSMWDPRFMWQGSVRVMILGGAR